MNKLKNALEADYNAKTKTELVDVIKGIKTVIGQDYEELVGITDSELAKLRKDELVNVIAMLREGYNGSWENKLSAASNTVRTVFAEFSAQDDQFSTSNASDAGFAAELGSLDFDKLIGGPLNACVTAQANASLSTVNFIKEVGFDKDGKLIMVDFSHTRVSANPNKGKDPAEVPPGTDVASDTISEEVKLSVPFVSVLNIPSMRIENCTIDLNVKLNSVYTKDVSTKLGISAQASGGFGPVKFKVSASYQRSTSTGVRVEKEYSLGVKVVATNDEMPAGLDKVLGILAQ